MSSLLPLLHCYPDLASPLTCANLFFTFANVHFPLPSAGPMMVFYRHHLFPKKSDTVSSPALVEISLACSFKNTYWMSVLCLGGCLTLWTGKLHLLLNSLLQPAMGHGYLNDPLVPSPSGQESLFNYNDSSKSILLYKSTAIHSHSFLKVFLQVNLGDWF